MPFIGRDWRAAGDSWVRTQVGWERKKLRPLEVDRAPTVFTLDEDECAQAVEAVNEVTCGSPLSCVNLFTAADGSTAAGAFRPRVRLRQSSECRPPVAASSPRPMGGHQAQSMCDVGRWSLSPASTDDAPSSPGSTAAFDCAGVDEMAFRSTVVDEPAADDFETDDNWIPHCFVKTNKSREFVGCTSMSEAFHKLDMARAVTDVRRFNYVSKVVQILVDSKLQNLSGSGRRILLSVVESLAAHCASSYTRVDGTRQLLEQFAAGLKSGQHCGSPSMLTRHAAAAQCLAELIETARPVPPSESTEDSVTLLDLPEECVQAVLRRLDSHHDLARAADAHPILEQMVLGKQAVADQQRQQQAKRPPVGIWLPLCRFHFTPEQIEAQANKSAAAGRPDDWRHIYFELKKYHGLRELYADMIHICCHCKALFWQRLGHPCVGDRPPSVRVTPGQFVDMLMLL